VGAWQETGREKLTLSVTNALGAVAAAFGFGAVVILCASWLPSGKRTAAELWSLYRSEFLIVGFLLLPAAGAWRMARIGKSAAPKDKDGLTPPSSRYPRAVQTFVFWRAPFAYCEHCRRGPGNSFTLRSISHPPMVFFVNPGDVRAIMTAPPDVLHPGEGGATLEPVLGEHSFMLLDEEEHLNGRRAVLPALQRRTVERDADRTIDTVRAAVASWPCGVSVRLHPRLRRLTLELVLQRIFAARDLGNEDRLPALRDKALAMLSVTGSVVLPLPVLRHGRGRTIWQRFLRQRADMDELIYEIVSRRRTASRSDSDDVLAMLLEGSNADGSALTQRQLRDNVMTMLVAGHETTAAQLAWVFQLLAHNASVQQRLIDEIDANAGDTYMTATINEALRHRPVFLFTVPRVVKQPIEIGGWLYEPPTLLLGCTYLLHHDPEVYPEPEVFRPERFLEGQPSPYTYMPWGGGRRRCPGSHVALLSMKTVLRTVLETMTVNPASRRIERPQWRSVIVTPRAGSRVVLRRRERRRVASVRARRAAGGACPTTIRTADLVEHR